MLLKPNAGEPISSEPRPKEPERFCRAWFCRAWFCRAWFCRAWFRPAAPRVVNAVQTVALCSDSVTLSLLHTDVP
ncbi:hypothetical protein EYF80_061151 [Liparis tanakae]|uniref:Uncharacterized protein n=1 Tax=Liparis tanakae TaxID=230148 RepID=A0A4Z2EJ98_9TELE|nr:hypothetical protein EYF80_061151 [Liparis tanakae]